MWSTTENNAGGIMGILFIIIIIWAIFGGGFGNGLNRRDDGGCYQKSVCDAMIQEIKDTATTQYLIETSANRTIATDNDNTRRLYDQSARQYEAGLQKEIFNAQMAAQTNAILQSNEIAKKDAEIAILKSEKYIDAKFDNLNQANNMRFGLLESGQREIACNMPVRPPYYAQGFINCGQPIPQGINGYGCAV